MQAWALKVPLQRYPILFPDQKPGLWSYVLELDIVMCRVVRYVYSTVPGTGTTTYAYVYRVYVE